MDTASVLAAAYLLSVGLSIQREAMDVVRFAPQGDLYRADVIYLIKKGARALWYSGLCLLQLGSRPTGPGPFFRLAFLCQPGCPTTFTAEQRCVNNPWPPRCALGCIKLYVHTLSNVATCVNCVCARASEKSAAHRRQPKKNVGY